MRCCFKCTGPEFLASRQSKPLVWIVKTNASSVPGAPRPVSTKSANSTANCYGLREVAVTLVNEAVCLSGNSIKHTEMRCSSQTLSKGKTVKSDPVAVVCDVVPKNVVARLHGGRAEREWLLVFFFFSVPSKWRWRCKFHVKKFPSVSFMWITFV